MDTKTLRSLFKNLDLSDFGYEVKLIYVHKENDHGVHQCDLAVACSETIRLPVFVNIADHGVVRYAFFLAFEKGNRPDIVAAELIELCNELNGSATSGVACLATDPSTADEYITVTLTHTFVIPPSFYEDTAQSARAVHTENIGCFVQAMLRVQHSLSNWVAELNERDIFDSKMLLYHPGFQ